MSIGTRLLALLLFALPVAAQQTIGGNGGGGSSVATTVGVYAQTFTPFAGKQARSCTWTSGLATITGCPAGFFTSTAVDAGKIAFATNQVTGFTSFVSSDKLCNSTILSVQSDTAATLNANCTGNSGTNFPFIYGPDETVGLKAAVTAAAAVCGTLIIPAGISLVTADPFVTIPDQACVRHDSADRGSVTILGQGQNSSIIGIVPSFDFTTCTLGNSGTACLGTAGTSTPGGYNLERFLINGWGSQMTVAAAHNMIEMNAGSYILNMSCTGVAAANLNLTGLSTTLPPVSISQNQIDGCGAIEWNNSTSNVQVSHGFYGDGASSALINSGSMVSVNNIWGDCTGNAVNCINLSNAASLFQSTNDVFQNAGGGNNDTTFAISSSGRANLLNCKITSGGTNATTVFVGLSGAQLSLSNCSIGAGSGTGTSLNTVAGTITTYGNGNSITGATAVIGSVVADGHALKGACTGVATASSTLGLYGTGPNVTATTCTSTNIGSGVPISGARTMHVLQVSATAGGVGAGSGVVTVLKNGGATTITCTIGTGTSCQDNAHSVSFADGDLISIQFTTAGAETLAGVKAQIIWD